jgi:hypothetical protein
MTRRRPHAYTVANREDAIDFMADYPEYGGTALVHERSLG